MALDLTIFQTIIPSRFISFTIPNPALFSELLRVAVLDSPTQPTESPRVALLFVPFNRESDWVFSTEFGHLQLLLSSPGISRLILIGKNPIDPPDSVVISYKKDNGNNAQFVDNISVRLKPLIVALAPKILVKDSIFDVPILEYEDNLVSSVVLERCIGVFVGEMLVEDVEIENYSELDVDCGKREFRRRMRFKRMPNFIQTEIKIVPQTDIFLNNSRIVGEVDFRPDIGSLVHPYLIPMVAGLSLVGCHIEDRIQHGFMPTALCLGVGGGALLSFLRAKLDFEVSGVEMDEEVLRIARQYFGLQDSGFKVLVGDAIEILERLVCPSDSSHPVSVKVDEDCSNNTTGFDAKFDVLMVDLDSRDARSGISAPPLEFIHRHVLFSASSILRDLGVLIVNVIPPGRSFYDTLVHKVQEVFHELYEIDVGNGENFVLIAKKVPDLSLVRDTQNTFLKKLKESISGKYWDSIRKI